MWIRSGARDPGISVGPVDLGHHIIEAPMAWHRSGPATGLHHPPGLRSAPVHQRQRDAGPGVSAVQPGPTLASCGAALARPGWPSQFDLPPLIGGGYRTFVLIIGCSHSGDRRRERAPAGCNLRGLSRERAAIDPSRGVPPTGCARRRLAPGRYWLPARRSRWMPRSGRTETPVMVATESLVRL